MTETISDLGINIARKQQEKKTERSGSIGRAVAELCGSA